MEVVDFSGLKELYEDDPNFGLTWRVVIIPLNLIEPHIYLIFSQDGFMFIKKKLCILVSH
jgi:hypothetical protein